MELTQEQVQVLGTLADAVKGMGTDKKGLVPHQHTGILLHGPGGIFSTFGLDREIINAHMIPEGIGSILSLNPSMDTDPRYGTLTGVTQSYGDQPTNTCDFAPHAYLKGCNLTARFGRIRYDTNTIEFDAVITKYNRGDFTDLTFLGSLLSEDGVAKGLSPINMSADDFLNVVTLAEMLVVGVQAHREITRQNWQGNILVANEYPGLAAQIATGQMDADRPGVLCTALDSDVKDFQFADVCGTVRDIVEYINMMHWYLRFNARRMRLAPVKWVVAMRPELWYELSACYPCRYLTNRCLSSAGVQVGVINDRTNVDMSEKLRTQMQLPMNGEWVDVVIDDGIQELNGVAGHTNYNANLNPGEFASDIFFVPLTILGNFPATYREYLNYRSPIANANVAQFASKRAPDFWTDNGIFSWAYDGQLWCFLLGLKTEQRIILRTPQLAGRIDHVRYTPMQHLRSPYPSSSHYQDGGVSVRDATRTSYAVWAGGAISD